MDYSTHPDFQLNNPYHTHYGPAIGRLGAAFAADSDKDKLLAEAYAALKEFTPAGCKAAFGLGSGYSLAKEFYCDIMCTNAAVVARILEQRGEAAQARDFLFELYARIAAAGFTREHEFFLNRLDSRTFMPMRRHIDRAYLEGIGYTHLDNILLCVGDCQTMITSEKVRDTLPLNGIDIAAYQHGLGSLTSSPLAQHFRPVAYYNFVNAAADYGLFAKDGSQREGQLNNVRERVAWLKTQQPKMCVFVTHVFYGVENAIQNNKVPRENAMEACFGFSDEVAAILAEAPNARLINFQEICPFTLDRSVFRDKPTDHNLLHFRFDIMQRVNERLSAVLSELTPW